MAAGGSESTRSELSCAGAETGPESREEVISHSETVYEVTHVVSFFMFSITQIIILK